MLGNSKKNENNTKEWGQSKTPWVKLYIQLVAFGIAKTVVTKVRPLGVVEVEGLMLSVIFWTISKTKEMISN